jgi:hypothetical protein
VSLCCSISAPTIPSYKQWLTAVVVCAEVVVVMGVVFSWGASVRWCRQRHMGVHTRSAICFTGLLGIPLHPLGPSHPILTGRRGDCVGVHGSHVSTHYYFITCSLSSKSNKASYQGKEEMIKNNIPRTQTTVAIVWACIATGFIWGCLGPLTGSRSGSREAYTEWWWLRCRGGWW